MITINISGFDPSRVVVKTEAAPPTVEAPKPTLTKIFWYGIGINSEGRNEDGSLINGDHGRVYGPFATEEDARRRFSHWGVYTVISREVPAGIEVY